MKYEDHSWFSQFRQTRVTEWMLSFMLLTWGINVIRPDAYFSLPAYQVMGAVMSESRWATMVMIIAVLRMVGLSINGWWKRSPILRFIGAMAGGLTWLSIGFLMWAASGLPGATLPAGILWYIVLMAAEGLCVAATGYDMNKNGSLQVKAVANHVTR